jgi:hypothetical protein
MMAIVTDAETDTGAEGRAFVRARLAGGLSLSSVVHERTDLDQGLVFTWAAVPSPPHLLEFDRGDVVDGHTARARVLGLIRAFFENNRAGSLWVEEPLPKRSDPFWSNPDIPEERKAGWFLGEEVYSAAFPEDDDNSLIKALCNAWQWGGWGGAAYLTTSPAASRYRQEHELRANDLGDFASHVQVIICPAYDGEGYLIWQPVESPA